MERPTVPSKIEIPPDFSPYIFPHEKVINIQDFPEHTPLKTPSSLRELYRLAQAKIRSEIGDFGPPLASLAIESDPGSEKNGGQRLYEALFGRDSLRVAIDTLPLYPRLARATILALAELQGTGHNKHREEEPGRIPHEVRKPDDPIAQAFTEKRGWQWPYYGSVDATPEFVRTIAAYCQQSKEGDAFLFQHYKDKDGVSRIVADGLVFAVSWIEHRMDSKQEGLLEYRSTLPGELEKAGIENQVWKDSPDSYFHEDGSFANHNQGIASIEVQRVTYDALLDAANLYEKVLGRADDAVRLRARAAGLRKTVLEKFWCGEKGGYFILGTDRDEQGNLRPLKIRTSNMGHVLYSGLLEEETPEAIAMKEAVVRQLFSPEMLNVSGIRTLASDEKRFRPGAYHNGSVWLWDTHLIAKGLRRQGYHHLAENITERLFNVINTTHKFPEFVRGDSGTKPSLNTRIIDIWDEKNHYTNRVEQPPQEVQAWSVAAIIALKHYRGKHRQLPDPLPLEIEVLRQIT